MAKRKIPTRYQAMRDALEWIVLGWESGESISGPKVAHGISEARRLVRSREFKAERRTRGPRLPPSDAGIERGG